MHLLALGPDLPELLLQQPSDGGVVLVPQQPLGGPGGGAGAGVTAGRAEMTR